MSNVSRLGRIGPNLPGTANVHSVLSDAAKGIDKINAKKALVILLNDDSPDVYDSMWLNAGMTLSEAVALLEITKAQILRMMSESEETI